MTNYRQLRIDLDWELAALLKERLMLDKNLALATKYEAALRAHIDSTDALISLGESTLVADED